MRIGDRDFFYSAGNLVENHERLFSKFFASATFFDTRKAAIEEFKNIDAVELRTILRTLMLHNKLTVKEVNTYRVMTESVVLELDQLVIMDANRIVTLKDTYESQKETKVPESL